MVKKTYRGHDLKQTAQFYNNFDYTPSDNETENEFNEDD